MCDFVIQRLDTVTHVNRGGVVEAVKINAAKIVKRSMCIIMTGILEIAHVRAI